ncbi:MULTISPECIES: GNAT family N-acetyltransferase [unclassified Leifsonia]|uniref:GNAT family N-acetyltransferase n=1 Tax=unclassified Leifsonia TaxID=2663824 RepID=UPI0006F9BFD1|nr:MULTISPECIES: GNAT family N-acetyltransferase [unclassified Leifsonia]KQX07688.1 hypothetical protein ASC59_08125 [Leifsonia sp. Root1293]KRA11970.1 hypothetical protein ASD61_08125 [Leifsonia sp. Root60]
MSAGDETRQFEYPDSAGYPDGSGFLDEGTAATVDDVARPAAHAVDQPSAEAESEIQVRHRSEEHIYAAMAAGRQIATLRYDIVDGRMVLLATTVEPEFRGRGIASDLIADALDDIRVRGMKVTVRCPVVAAFIAENGQFADVVLPAR